MFVCVCVCLCLHPQERGLRIKRHNEKVRSSGIGVLLPERATDTVPEVARERYRTFVAHYKTIEKLKQVRFCGKHLHLPFSACVCMCLCV